LQQVLQGLLLLVVAVVAAWALQGYLLDRGHRNLPQQQQQGWGVLVRV
jgi:hypothetical protein